MISDCTGGYVKQESEIGYRAHLFQGYCLDENSLSVERRPQGFSFRHELTVTVEMVSGEDDMPMLCAYIFIDQGLHDKKNTKSK